MFLGLYFISILDYLRIFIFTTFIILAIIAFIFFLISLFSEYFREEELFKNIKKISQKAVIVSLIFIFLGCFIPSTKNMIIIYSLNTFSKSEIFKNTNTIVNKSLLLLEKKLDKYLKEDDVK